MWQNIVLASLSFALMPARGDDYTSRRLTLIAPWPPAGAVSWRQGAAELLGQPVVVENRPGEG